MSTLTTHGVAPFIPKNPLGPLRVIIIGRVSTVHQNESNIQAGYQYRVVKYSAEHFDRENRGVETRQAVQSQLKCPRALVRRRSNLGAEKQICGRLQ